MPKIPGLLKLELSDNKLTSLAQVAYFRKLESLKVTNNYIKQESCLRPLATLKNLTNIYLQGNPLCDLLDHTVKVFEVLPYVKNVDGINREGEDCMTDEYD